MKTTLIAIGIMLGFCGQWNIAKAENTGECIDIQDQGPLTTTNGNCTGVGNTCGGTVTVATGNTDDYVCVYGSSGDYSSCMAGTATGELSVQTENCVEDSQIGQDEQKLSDDQELLQEAQSQGNQAAAEGFQEAITSLQNTLANLDANAPCDRVPAGQPTDGGPYTALANTGAGTCNS